MSKCEDAHQLVDMYAKYNKTNKILGYIAVLALVLYISYDIYSGFGEFGMTRTIVFAAIGIIIIGALVWSLFRKRDKQPVEKELDRLRDMISKE